MASEGSNPGITLTSAGPKSFSFESIYKLDRRLSSGSYGTVYTCRALKDSPEEYAVKVIDRTSIKKHDDDSVFREVEILKELKPLQHIIEIIDFFEAPDTLYVVQELAQGGDVFDRLAQRSSYTEKDARDLARILLQTIDAMHNQYHIAHRDLKPENLLLKDILDDSTILLADFGFAKHTTQKLKTRCGTPAFVAPEILVGQPYNQQCDMWSTGCVLYMLMGGYAPFQAEDHRRLFRKVRGGDYVFHDKYWKNVTVEAKNLIATLLAVDPADRCTAQKALEAPWMSTKLLSDQSLSSHDLSTSLSEIKTNLRPSLRGKDRFRSAVHAVQWALKARFWNPDTVSFAQQLKLWDGSKASSKKLSFKETYELRRKISKGSFATVVECRHRENGDKYAVKIIKREGLKPADDQAILNEVAVMQSLKGCPYIVELVDFFEEDDYFFLVMEYMEGGDVFDRISEKTKYTERDARDLVKVLLKAVDFLHTQGISHRDLKPQNLLLKTRESNADIKLGDFGFARRVHTPQSLTTRCGTPTFVAPEILKNIPHDTRADMWSVGVCIHVILVGYPPFTDDNQSELFRKIRSGEWEFFDDDWKGISDDAKELIRGCLVVDPVRRWSAKEALRCKWIQENEDILSSRTLDDSLRVMQKTGGRLKNLSKMVMWFAGNAAKPAKLATQAMERVDEDDESTEGTEVVLT